MCFTHSYDVDTYILAISLPVRAMFPLVRCTVFLRSTVQCSYVPVSSFLPLDDCSVNANDLHLLRFEIRVYPLLCDLLSHRLAGKGFRGSPGWSIDGHVLGNLELLRENVGATKQPSLPWHDHRHLVKNCLFGVRLILNQPPYPESIPLYSIHHLGTTPMGYGRPMQ